MSKITEISSAVQNLAKQYAAVIEMGKFLEGIGPLENIENETKERIVAFRAQEKKAVADAAEAQKRFIEIQAAQAQAVKAAREQIDKTINEGQNIARNLIAEAREKARTIAEQATVQHAALLAKHDVSSKAFQELQNKVSAKKAELEALKNGIDLIRKKFL